MSLSVCEPVQDGYTYVYWVSKYLGECVYTPLEVASVFVGLSSIVCWIFAQFPQIVKNFQLRRADSLSGLFLLQWFLGDTSNLSGCLLTHQNATQTYTAIYFVIMDVVLFSQWIWYNYLVKKIGRRNEGIEETSGLLSSKDTTFAMFFTIFALRLFVFGTESQDLQFDGTGRKMMSVVTDDIGIVLGWVSAAFYLGSRVPQIIMNIRRKSTDGLSPIMFTMAVMGNVTYASSIFMFSTDATYLKARLPWLTGSLGTLFFDGTTLIQFMYYRKPTPKFDDPLERKQLINKADA